MTRKGACIVCDPNEYGFPCEAESADERESHLTQMRTETITVSTCRACGAEYRSSSAKAVHRCKAGWKTRKETREVQYRISYQPGHEPRA